MVARILLLAIVGLVALISFQNVTEVSISLLFWRFETTLSAIIFIAVLAGVVVAQLVRQWATGRGVKVVENGS